MADVPAERLCAIDCSVMAAFWARHAIEEAMNRIAIEKDAEGTLVFQDKRKNCWGSEVMNTEFLPASFGSHGRIANAQSDREEGNFTVA